MTHDSCLPLQPFLDVLDPTSINITEVIHLKDMLTVLAKNNKTSNRDDFQVAIESLDEVIKRMEGFKMLVIETRESILGIDKGLHEMIISFDAATTALLNCLEVGVLLNLLRTWHQKYSSHIIRTTRMHYWLNRIFKLS